MSPKSPLDTDQPGIVKSATDIVKRLIKAIEGLPQAQQALVLVLLIASLFVIAMTLIVSRGVLSEGALVVVVVAFLVVLVVILYIFRSGNSEQTVDIRKSEQKVEISGSVVDGSENPVTDASVWVEPGDAKTTTDNRGRYKLEVTLGPKAWRVKATKDDLRGSIEVGPGELEQGDVPAFKILPPEKSDYEKVLEDLEATSNLINEHQERVKKIIKPVKTQASQMDETIQEFCRFVDKDSARYQKEYASLVYGSLHKRGDKLKDKELGRLLDQVVEEVRRFNANAFTYDSLDLHSKLPPLSECLANWDTKGGSDSAEIKAAHHALSESLAGFIAKNSAADATEDTKKIEQWEKELQEFRAMPIDTPADVQAVVQKWAAYWQYHVGRTRHHGYLGTAIRRFKDAVEKEQREPVGTV